MEIRPRTARPAYRSGPHHRRPALRGIPCRGVRVTARGARSAGGWLAVRPKEAVADLAKQLHAQADDGPALARVFQHAYASLPAPAARILRLLSLAPDGHVDPHNASALAGCSVSAARTTLDDFVALGRLHAVDSQLPQYEVPGCLYPLLNALTDTHDRPAELQLARARMLERTVRLLQSCRAVTETDSSPEPGEARGGCRAPCASPVPGAAEDWLRVRRARALPASAAAGGRRRGAGHPRPAA